MTVLNVKKDEHFITGSTRMENICCLVKGSVYQLSHEDEVKLEAGSIIGIMDCFRGEYLCDYVAAEDCVLYAYPYRKPADLVEIYQTQPKFSSVFLTAVIKTTAQIFERYSMYQKLAKSFYTLCIDMCRQYKFLCTTYHVPEKMVKRIEYLKQFNSSRQIPEWKITYYASIVKMPFAQADAFYANNYDVVNGQVLMAGEDIDNAVRLIDEIRDYLECNQNVLLCEDRKDIFQMFFDMAKKAALINTDISTLKNELEKQKKFIIQSGLYEKCLMKDRILEYEQCDFTTLSEDDLELEEIGEPEEEAEEEPEEEGEDCFAHIMNYAGYESAMSEKVRGLVVTYRELPDMLATDDDTRKLRRSLNDIFYDIYTRVFKQTLNDSNPSPIIKMFLNFGFLDVALAGQENANELYDLTDRLFLCESDHVFTIYKWLMSIYEGKNEPSRNEFDLDYPAYLRDEKKQGKITAEQEETLKEDNWNKVQFEINNMFRSTNRSTYGRISTFCPVLAKHDLISSAQSMLVTCEKLEHALDLIKGIDYEAFYHDVLFSDPEHGINKEILKKEIMPQIILMPNAGNRAMMWQETAGVRRDTPARFIMPVFTMASIDEMMLETVGRYRWEYCRKVQGARWNDVTDKSLTAEYCDYIQFYRKNRDLTSDAKEKIKNELFRAKNNYREVFVKDYVNWIKYESSGSFRLNKIARTILFTYCPFSLKCRTALMKNPIFQPMIERSTILKERELKRIKAVYDHYGKNGGEVTEEMKESLEYYNK